MSLGVVTLHSQDGLLFLSIASGQDQIGWSLFVFLSADSENINTLK
jgi:hypothetical protein